MILYKMLCDLGMLLQFLNHHFAGMIDEKKGEEDNDDYLDSKRTSVRSSVYPDSDSD